MQLFEFSANLAGWISRIISFLVLYKMLMTVIGFFTTRKYPSARENHNYAVVIAARNEESVIAELIRSVFLQAYPREMLTVFVVADNCTDRTAEIARKEGAICYERDDAEHRTKGFALKYLFEKIKEDYGEDAFEGFFVFDADNVLKRDFIARMNEAFDAGEKVIVGYRNTKNFSDNWISASYALHWLRTARTEHRGRSAVGLSARVQGTGFLFAKELVKDGWNYTSFTEDRAFSADAVVKGIKIAYCDNAEFYDEQPRNLRISARQRIRWAKGHLQSFRESGMKLLKAAAQRKSFVCYDMFWTVVPENLVSFLLRFSALLFGLFALSGDAQAKTLFINYAKNFGAAWLGASLTAAYVLIMERKRIAGMSALRKTAYCVLFPLFDLIGLLSTLYALFARVEWKPIPHTARTSMEELENARGERHK